MNDFILDSELMIRLGIFISMFVVVATWEVVAPRRRRVASLGTRWPSNLGVAALNTLLARVVAPAGVVGLALVADALGWGMMNQVSLPFWLAVALSVLMLDLAIYLQHVLFHAVPVLWRLHRMHHADLDFDVTTGVRFHPIEILLSLGIKLCVVAALGLPAVAALIFEVLLNATALFNHGNVRLPHQVDRFLRLIVVTPDMHRVHHSVLPEETNSNFGFNFPWWDRLLGTYRAQPVSGHDAMTIGIDQFRESRELRLDRMLVQPFKGGLGGHDINRGTR